MLNLHNVQFTDTEGLYNTYYHEPVVSGALEALHCLRKDLNELNTVATLVVKPCHYLLREGVSIMISCMKPLLTQEFQFYSDAIRLQDVALDRRVHGKSTVYFPLMLRPIIANPRGYSRVLLIAGMPVGYIVWLRYGFYPTKEELKKFSYLFPYGWKGTAKDLVRLSGLAICKPLIRRHRFSWSGYLDVRDSVQVARSLEYIDRRLGYDTSKQKS